MKCDYCASQLERATFCPSCEGAGGWGDWIETGDDICLTCGGTGEPQEGEDSVSRWHCPKCRCIYPPMQGKSP